MVLALPVLMEANRLHRPLKETLRHLWDLLLSHRGSLSASQHGISMFSSDGCFILFTAAFLVLGGGANALTQKFDIPIVSGF